MLSACTYTTKPYTCYTLRQTDKNPWDADYLCMANEDMDLLHETTSYKLNDNFLVFLTNSGNKNVCSLEEYDRESDEYFVYDNKKINLKKQKVYSCPSGTIQPYIKKLDQEAEKLEKQRKEEEKKKKAEEAKKIKQWEKYTGCNYKKSIYLPSEAYETFQQQKEGLTVIVKYGYRYYADNNNLPWSFFVIQNKIDSHFVDNEAWLGGWFEDTGVDRKYINGLGHTSRLRKYKRCIDAETIKKFKEMGIQ